MDNEGGEEVRGVEDYFLSSRFCIFPTKSRGEEEQSLEADHEFSFEQVVPGMTMDGKMGDAHGAVSRPGLELMLQTLLLTPQRPSCLLLQSDSGNGPHLKGKPD